MECQYGMLAMQGSTCAIARDAIIAGNRSWLSWILAPLFLAAMSSCATAAPIATGPLHASESNPRYFVDGTGKTVVLVGSHTWPNFQDAGPTDPPPQFDYDRYLGFLAEHDHNFFRLWTWEQAKWVVSEKDPYWFAPLPYQRTGPGLALDGKPRFDLSKFDDSYFARLRQRVAQAGQRGIYVSIMLFNGFSVEEQKGDKHASNPWHGHPFNRDNNINGVDGDPDHADSGRAVHTLRLPRITAIQDAYVRKVIDTVGDLDNVLYEVSNESSDASTQWQYHMIDLIKRYEATKAKRHPVGMTVEWPGGSNADLFASRADWISPNQEGGNFLRDPAVADGRKVIILDTDHLCGICGDSGWAWKAFTRGHNPVFMDPYGYLGTEFGDPTWVSLRDNLGYIRRFAERIDLGLAQPRPELASTGYCLATLTPMHAELLVYLPSGGTTNVDLRAIPGNLMVEWFNPADGTTTDAASIPGGAKRLLAAPFGGDAVLFLRQSRHGISDTPDRKPSWIPPN